MSSPTSQLSTTHFRDILAKNTTTLKKLCDHWSKLLDPNEDDEAITGAIRSTVGQANLLMSQRFKQFAELIDKCEFDIGPMPTRLDDLLGFWEMIEYQVDDVVKKFNSLEDEYNNRTDSYAAT